MLRLFIWRWFPRTWVHAEGTNDCLGTKAGGLFIERVAVPFTEADITIYIGMQNRPVTVQRRAHNGEASNKFIDPSRPPPAHRLPDRTGVRNAEHDLVNITLS